MIACIAEGTREGVIFVVGAVTDFFPPVKAREYASGDRLFTNILASAAFESAQLFTRGFAAKQYARIGNPTSHAPELCRLLKCESVTPLHWFRISLNTT